METVTGGELVARMLAAEGVDTVFGIVDGSYVELNLALPRHGIRLVFLEVRESNSAARFLYQRAGFETVGRRSGYYAHPVEDALVMSIETG